MTYEIIKRLKDDNQELILQQLQSAVTDKEKAKGQLHKVFEESFDAKSIDNKKFFLQKLNYIHLNPVRGNYKLVADWREYEHSSAGFYELQQLKHFAPVHGVECVTVWRSFGQCRCTTQTLNKIFSKRRKMVTLI